MHVKTLETIGFYEKPHTRCPGILGLAHLLNLDHFYLYGASCVCFVHSMCVPPKGWSFTDSCFVVPQRQVDREENVARNMPLGPLQEFGLRTVPISAVAQNVGLAQPG